MDLMEVEARLGMKFPERHRDAMLNTGDPIHKACDFLVPSSPYDLLEFVRVNESLHASDRWNRWPPFLIAFASNGCADYFAYDLRSCPPTIIYIDPDLTVEENLQTDDKLEYRSFEDWHADRVRRRCT